MIYILSVLLVSCIVVNLYCRFGIKNIKPTNNKQMFESFVKENNQFKI
jgi:hypothetical protein